MPLQCNEYHPAASTEVTGPTLTEALSLHGLRGRGLRQGPHRPHRPRLTVQKDLLQGPHGRAKQVKDLVG